MSLKPLLFVVLGLTLVGCASICKIAPSVCNPTPPPPPVSDCTVTGCPEGQTCEAVGTKDGSPTQHYCMPQPPAPPQPQCALGEMCGCFQGETPLTCAPKEGATVQCEDGICVYTPVPTPEPTPPPLAPGAYVYMKMKGAGHGFDSTPRVHGDPAFCALVGGAGNDCHLDGMKDKALKVKWEILLMGGCPVWEYKSAIQPTIVYQCHDDQDAYASCDHFGTQPAQDDPKTKNVFEGLPAQCGLQRDPYGPIAGFFTVAHGKGFLRACAPNDVDRAHCSDWLAFDH